MSEAFGGFAEKLLAARPEHAVVRLFVPSARRDFVTAFEALVLELEQASRLDEPSVAAAKLHWWGGELDRARGGEARHPLTQVLFPTARPDLDARLPGAIVAATLARLEREGEADFARQLAALESLHAPLAAFGDALLHRPADPAHARLRALAELLRDLAHSKEHALPLQLLARHQLARSDIARGGAAVEAAVRDQLAVIGETLAAIDAACAPLPVRVRRRLDLALVARARRADAPVQALRAALGRAPAATVWHAWREARRSVA